MISQAEDKVYRRWQMRAYRALGDLMQQADLPVIDWQVTHLGYVIGNVHKRPGEAGCDGVRARWQLWVDFLMALTWQTENSGTINLHADAKQWGEYEVDVFVLATAWDEESGTM